MREILSRRAKLGGAAFDLQYLSSYSSNAMDRLRKKLNNSASLGKTLSRANQQQLHYSYFMEPREFDHQSNNDPRESHPKTCLPRQIEATPKISAAKPHRQFAVIESLAKIQNSRVKCQQISPNIQTALLEKSLRLNKLYKDMHHFATCIEEIRWILTEGDSLMQAYLAKTTLLTPQSGHTKDLGNIAKEYRALMLRFGNVDRGKMMAIEDFLRCDRLEKMDEYQTMGYTNVEELRFNPEGKLPNFSQNVSYITRERDNVKESRNSSIIDSRQFTSNPLKQNVNSLNMTTEFDNIKLVKPQKTVEKPNIRERKDMGITTAQSIREKDEDFEREKEELEREKEQLYSKLHAEHNRNEQLMGRNEMLSQEIAGYESKMTKYKVASFKSIQQLTEILKAMMGELSRSQREFELLKMAQCLNTWERMMEEDQQEAKYRQLYGNSEAMQADRTQKLQEIIELQYEINNLLGQRKCLKKEQGQIEQRKQEKEVFSEDLYRMLAMQAFTLEEFCK